MKVEICIPAFNEERIIVDAVQALSQAFADAGKDVEITVADNGSTDKTASVAGAISGVSIVSVAKRGKGAGVISAARRSNADFFGFIDADLSVDPAEIIRLLLLLEKNECDIAIGSRLIDSSIVDRGMFRTLLSQSFNMLQKAIVGVEAQDTQCGLKLMNARGRKMLAECEESGWFFDMEFLARAERAGMRVREVPIHWSEHRFPGRESKLALGRDSIGALRAMFRIRRRVLNESRTLRAGGGVVPLQTVTEWERTVDSLVDFYLPYSDTLYEDPVFRKQILNCPFVMRDSASSEKAHFVKVLRSYLDEARLTLSLIRDVDVTKSDALLEVGGGLGLVYGYLKKQGYNSWGIEPCDSGFDGYYSAALALLNSIGVDASHFQSLLAKDVEKLGTTFDVIFSNNVFEHIPELDESILRLKASLKPDGIMVHNTVNYIIPYEPHFQILLIPFFPRATQFLNPSLKRSALWRGLHFVTTVSLKRMCKAHGLKIEFKKDRLLKTFTRLEYDTDFAKRQRYFVPVYRLLKVTRLLGLLRMIPVSLTTPITFSITKINLEKRAQVRKSKAFELVSEAKDRAGVPLRETARVSG